jgi:hypothetical protein
MDVDKNPEFNINYQVTNIPSIHYYMGGVHRYSFNPEENMEKFKEETQKFYK